MRTTLPAQSAVVRLVLRCTQCRHVDGRTQAGALLCHSCMGAGPDAAHFLEMTDRSGDCWLWMGPLHSGGYGKYATKYAHRVAYETWKGAIPDGFYIDHLCRNPPCVNPDHLEAVTPAENVRRGLRGRLPTHCKRGHLWTDENTYWRKEGRRQCRECIRIRWQRAA